MTSQTTTTTTKILKINLKLKLNSVARGRSRRLGLAPVARRHCALGCARATGSDSWTCAPDRWVGTHSLLLATYGTFVDDSMASDGTVVHGSPRIIHLSLQLFRRHCLLMGPPYNATVFKPGLLAVHQCIIRCH